MKKSNSCENKQPCPSAVFGTKYNRLNLLKDSLVFERGTPSSKKKHAIATGLVYGKIN